MFKVVTLKNGIKIAMEEMDAIRSVSFGIWVKNGSRNETRSENGISHFIEHMMFKGTDRRSAKDIADEMDAVGGQINAYTTKEYTCYYTRTLDSHLSIAMDVLSDMYLRSSFDETEIKKECNVIAEEIDMYEDTPEETVHDLLQSHIWENNPLGFSVIGEKNTISSFRRDSFKGYLKRHYSPENTVITLVGHFNPDEVVQRIEQVFGGFTGIGKEDSITPEVVYTPGISLKPKDIEQTHLCLGFPAISLGDDRSYDLTVMNTVFGGGMSSRLFQTIREENGMAYSVYSYMTPYTDTGLFTVYIGFNANQAEDVIRLTFDVIHGFFTDKVTREQLDKTREQLKSNFLLSLESTSSRMSSLGRSQLLLNRTLSDDEIVEKLDAVTLDSLYDMARLVFDMNKISMCVVGRLGDWDYEALLNNAKQRG
ncbi:MAG: insulinase family protein [Clostridiales bacterium]|jgi:predicted Zn-dependent peptidase|nr:insulinase family protein [Clostridiales bacterium]